jgi:hypothetical protein
MGNVPHQVQPEPVESNRVEIESYIRQTLAPTQGYSSISSAY